MLSFVCLFCFVIFYSFTPAFVLVENTTCVSSIFLSLVGFYLVFLDFC